MLLVLMVLTVVAVVMRKVFSRPVEGIQDLSEGGLLIVVFFSLAYAGWTGAHIFVDLAGGFIKGRASDYLNAAIRLICAVFFVVVTWQSAVQAMDAVEFGDAFTMIPVPLYPFYFVVAIGTGLYGLVLFLQAARSLAGLPDPETP